jgi:DNA adenine methylase
MIRPPLKWAGNKAGLLHRVLPRLPRGARLFEPCVGSGAVFLNTDYPAYVLSDTNAHLIEFYIELRDRGAQFVSECAELFHGDNNNAEAFYRLRAEFVACPDPRRRAVLFLFLNRHGFNGLTRYNRGGGYNVPFGRFSWPYFPARELLAMSARLQGVPLLHMDFEQAILGAQAGDVVYLDPPYTPLSATENFTAYTAAGFTAADHARMVRAAAAARSRGVTVVISNHDTPATRELYAAAKLYRFKAKRTISANSAKRRPAPELLAVYAPRLLHLNLRGERWDQIAAGTKGEEYRLAAKWRRQLEDRSYDWIVLKRGYPCAGDMGKILFRPWRGVELRTMTHPHFGAAPVDVYAIPVQGLRNAEI